MEDITFLAHISGDRKQTVADHLFGTAELSSKFANAFGEAESGRVVGLGHDFGKCSAEFQERLHGGALVNHASAGAVECAKLDYLWAASCIMGHHAGLHDVGNVYNDTSDTPTLVGRLKAADNGKIPVYTVPFTLPEGVVPHIYSDDFLLNSYFIRMLFSCLVDADFLDTESFMLNGQIDRSLGEPLDVLMQKLQVYIAPWQNPRTELNRCRCNILNACLSAGSDDKGFFTLTVPTGGGKTVSSVAFALSHALKHHMDRIIYVIPYTSIIEQTADQFRKIFGNENVVEHHSNAIYDNTDDVHDGRYKLMLATENWDAPIIVTTAVQFFESLYSNRVSKCRKLHNMSNSVIIFDEAQMLPMEQLEPCVAAISALVTQFRSSAILCTATQPVLGDLFQKYAPDRTFKELCPNVSDVFSKLKRVSFKNAGKLDAESLASELGELSQVLCVVNSRKSAQAVFEKLPPDGSYHLSTLMYPVHRRKVLAEIRQRLAEGKTCRVVSTSLIEAGVDVDFPCVYREMAGLDSILQAAGRCNREGKRSVEESLVVIFSGVSVEPRMLRINIGAMREVMDVDEDLSSPEMIQRYFRHYRSLRDDVDRYKIIEAFREGIGGCVLPFESVAKKFHFIDDATKTVYIPIDDGEKLVRQLQCAGPSRRLMRELGQYCVNIYEKQFNALLMSGSIELIGDDGAMLKDLSLYSKSTGLSVSENLEFLNI